MRNAAIGHSGESCTTHRPSCGIPPVAGVWAQLGEISGVSAVLMGNKQPVAAGDSALLSSGGWLGALPIRGSICNEFDQRFCSWA